MKTVFRVVAVFLFAFILWLVFSPRSPTTQPTVITYSAADTAQLDLGSLPTTFGSANQARELLKLIDQNPSAKFFIICYSTPEDIVTVAANTSSRSITRTHKKHSGKTTTETWEGYYAERLIAAASGGSLNDTPSGKRPGTFSTQ